MNYLCTHMRSGIFISTEGIVRLCCLSRESDFQKEISIEDIDDLNEYFNSNYYVNIRKDDVRNINLCQLCNHAEQLNQNSLRTMIKDTYDRHQINYSRLNDKCIIEHLDISFSNLCNQQCLMCRSEYSSKWYTFDKNNKNSIFKRNPVKYKKWTSEKNLNKIKKILSTVKLLTIKGGEPTIQNEVLDILLYIKNHNLNINVQIVTNLQDLSDIMLELITSIEKLKITISLDSVGKRYDWIRSGDWNKTINNLKNYVERCKYIPNFGYANTLNRWSAKSLIEDIQTVEQLNANIIDKLPYRPIPWYNINIANGPLYVSPFVLSKKERIDIIDQFENHFGPIINDSMKYKSLTINHLHNILSLENEDLTIDEIVIETSEKWKNEVDTLRKYKK